jgi:hypothetical protein
MKTTRVQGPTTITIELSERDAEVLCALVGGIRAPHDRPLFEWTRKAFDALDRVLPNRTAAFSDLFRIENGAITTRGENA